ncbi:type II toxin-antitoxin system VapC family toxin [Chamaesiphon sp.]|uniref:type II toxin-antitoxin system VapC family toxin n=1 Tax=Chamaesiphon sp. TaxID=2814140 RepID=UPI003593D3DD
MRILLGIHIFIWMATEPERLSLRLAASIIDRQNSLFLSLASIWEIQIKVALGKLDLKGDLATIVDIQIEQNSIQLLPIDLKHIYALSNLPPHHRDPFDRLLIAQSQVEEMTLATVDSAFDRYEIDRL